MKTIVLTAFALTLAGAAWSADPKPAAQPAATAATAQSEEEAVAQFRTELMADRAKIMGKALTLDAQQAAKFWPLFEQFQKEESAIIDTSMKALKAYGDHFQNLSDTDAMAYVNSMLERDQQLHDLRVKWLAKFQTAVGARSAASAIHLDRRLNNLTEVQLASKIPLVK
jgi:Spy/CpxP family protein refolding chaperone